MSDNETRQKLIDSAKKEFFENGFAKASLRKICTNAGAGKLGQALLSYKEFDRYGLNIVAAFDTDESIIDSKRILPADKMADICSRLKVHIGIICVPPECAQSVCDKMVASGILAIWNFAPVHLSVPTGVIVQYENLAASLAVLSQNLEFEIRDGHIF